MKSSGIKRGMAAVAISALAVAGIPALAGTAFADSVNTQLDNAQGPQEVELYNESGYSIKPDGTDSTVRLQAGGGTAIRAVRFEYSVNFAAFQTISEVERNDDGSFSTEWSPTDAPFNIAVGTPLIRVRAVGLGGPGGNVILDTDTGGTETLFGNNPNNNSINITADTQRGYYDSCLPGPITTIVNGTSSVSSIDPADAPSIAWMDGNGNQVNTKFLDPTNGDILETVAGGGSTFAGILSLAGYNFAGPPVFPAPQDPDQLVTQAETDAPGDDTEDFEGYTLYEQVVTTVTAVDQNNNVTPDPANIVVTVLDQNGDPIADVRVRNGSGANVGRTNAEGQVLTTQVPSNDFYFADTDCNSVFSPAAGDKRSGQVTNDLATSIVITSSPEGNIPVGSSVTETVTIRDTNGDVVVNELVKIRREGPGAIQDVQFFTTNAQGQVTYTFSCTQAGTATVNAAIDDPSQNLPGEFERNVTDTVQCGNAVTPPKPPVGGKFEINPAIKAKNTANGNDRILVRAKQADGANVKLYEFVGKNRRVGPIAEGRMNERGVVVFIIKDNNGPQKSSYKAIVQSTKDTQRGATQRRLVAKAGR